MKKYTDKIITTINKHLPTNEDAWLLLGFVNKEKTIYTFGNDSKIIGRLFEVLVKDALEAAAADLNYTLREAEKQTVYPDFYFEKEGGKKIAIDIKTTYRKTETSKYRFTGGSFTSFMRNGTKNIHGEYSDYVAHYILGIVYTREEHPTTGTVNIDDLNTIIPAYKNVEFFVQEKFRICGDSKGSGNTDNIGTISSNRLDPFIYGAGPFSYLGKDTFHDYWTHYPKYKDGDETKKSLYTNLPGYIEWIKKKDKEKGGLLEEKYNKYLEDFKKQEDTWNNQCSHCKETTAIQF